MKKLLLVALTTLLVTGSLPVLADDAPAAGKEIRVHKLKYFSDYDTMMNNVKLEDYAKAYPELLRYARYGDKQAQFLTGVLLISGQGVEANVGLGLVWIRLALEQQTTEWKNRYRDITKNISEQQLASLDPLYEEYKSKYGYEQQFMQCEHERVKFSNIVKHICKKSIFQDDYYKIVEYDTNN